MRRFWLAGCNDHANFGRLHKTMTAKLRPSLDFDLSLLFISQIWRVGWTPDFKRIAAPCNLPWGRDGAPQFNRLILNENRIPKLVCSIGMLPQDLVHFGQRLLIHKCA
jgi:hypothetical protein